MTVPPCVPSEPRCPQSRQRCTPSIYTTAVFPRWKAGNSGMLASLASHTSGRDCTADCVFLCHYVCLCVCVCECGPVGVARPAFIFQSTGETCPQRVSKTRCGEPPLTTTLFGGPLLVPPAYPLQHPTASLFYPFYPPSCTPPLHPFRPDSGGHPRPTARTLSPSHPLSLSHPPTLSSHPPSLSAQALTLSPHPLSRERTSEPSQPEGYEGQERVQRPGLPHYGGQHLAQATLHALRRAVRGYEPWSQGSYPHALVPVFRSCLVSFQWSCSCLMLRRVPMRWWIITQSYEGM